MRLTLFAPALVLLASVAAGPARADDAPPPPGTTAGAIAQSARPHHVFLVGTLRITRPWIDVDATTGEVPGYLVIENHGSADDRLTGASVAGAASVRLAKVDSAPTDALVVPANGRLVLAKGGAHLTITGLPDGQRGQAVGGTLRFARAGALPLSFSTDRSETDQDDQTAPTPPENPMTLQQ